MRRKAETWELEIERLQTIIQLAIDRLRYGEPDKCILATLEKARKETLLLPK